MNDFPLAPFLISLASDGISIAPDDYERLTLVLGTRGEWSRQQLYGVLSALLTHTPEQVSTFRQRFDAFFAKNLPLAESVGEETVRGAVEELLQIKSGDFDFSPPEQPQGDSDVQHSTTSAPELTPADELGKGADEETLKSRLLEVLEVYGGKLKYAVAPLAAAMLIMIGFSIYPTLQRWRNVKGPVNSNSAADNTNQKGIAGQPTQNTGQRTDTPNQNRPNLTPTPTQGGVKGAAGNSNGAAAAGGGVSLGGLTDFQLFLLLGGLGTLITLPLITRLRMKERLAPALGSHEPLTFDPEGPDHFPLRAIGGIQSNHLDAAILDYLSRGLKYFISENPCEQLDIKASVHATGRNAGMYTPCFYRHKRILSVYILEDAYAEPFAWNPVARELATGLHRRGVSARYGNFYGSLEDFQMEDGGTLLFEELACERNEALILFFSDGKRLTRRRDGFFLEALGRWPAVAWLDMREKKFWDESAQLVRRFGIPLYQANRSGIALAMRRFVAERDAEPQDYDEAAGWKGIRANTRESLGAYIEDLVGADAVAWAQACSMIQPLSLGMADGLRRKCAPHLAPERVEGLFRLPNSAWNASGLHFSVPVLSALREGFAKSWSAREQEEILAFIIERVEEKEPPEKDSLRHLTWQWVLERIRLEVEPDSALKSLVRLSQTPLGDRIKNDFSLLYLPNEVMPQRGGIGLRLRPKTARGLLYFQYLAQRDVSHTGLSFVEWLKMLWYKALQVLEVVRSTEIRFTLDKIRGLWVAVAGGKEEVHPVIILAAERRLARRPTSILRVDNLHTYFPSEDGVVKAADGVSFDIDAGEVLALVGESGCGKSVSALSVMRLVSPPGEIVGGEVWFKDENLLEVSDKQMREVRGNRIAMIFQDPMSSLNPFMTVGQQIAEALRLHRKMTRRQAYVAAIESMREVAIPDPVARMNDYPHQLSGGMRQRVMIAMALACDPDILIADEPTTALDLATQAQVMELLKDLRRERKLAVLLITHDLGLIAGIADRVCVMYTGRVVEEADAREIFKHPRHPYTQGLLGSLVTLTNGGSYRRGYLPVIEGAVPSPTALPPGCHFAPRCPHRMERCTEEPMPLYYVGNRAEVRCVLYEQHHTGPN